MIALIPVFALVSFGQTEKSRLTGTVTDPTGAVIPEVDITATNSDTGIKRSAITNEYGFYTIPQLDPGTYDVLVRKEGFRSISRTGISLHVNGTVRVDFVLEVGQVVETLEVTGSPPLVDSATSDLGHVVERRQILDLPLNGRNTIALAVLVPGIRPQGTFGENPATVNHTGWGNFSANGGVANANEVLIDGVPATQNMYNGIGYMPPVDGTQEFKVQTNSYSAEFGHSSGGVINLSLKSGTNKLHGSVYEFMRNDKLDANDFFLNRTGQKKAPLRYNQFGFSAGGPVRKNKTFFFGLYEGFRQRDGRVLTTTVPTEREREGDLSSTFNSSGGLLKIFDPLTTRLSPDGKSYIRNAFPNNVIPNNRIDPVADKFAHYIWPLPNVAGTPPANINNFATSSSQATNQDQFTIKMDHHISDNHRLSGSYSYAFFDLGGWDPLGSKTTVLDNGRAEQNKSQFLNVTDSYLINTSTILEVRASYMRWFSDRLPMSWGQDLTAFGFPKSFVQAVQYQHLPTLNVEGVTDLAPATSSVIRRVENSYNGSGALTLIRGAHNIKVGGQYRIMQNNDVQRNNATGNFNFDQGFTRPDPLKASKTAGSGFASFLLGYPSGGAIGKSEPLAAQTAYGGMYVQDDWRLTSRLTLNLGLRYEIDPLMTERLNRLSWFDFDVVPERTAEYTGLPLRGGLVFADDSTRSPADTSYSQLGPRFGFAYNLFSKTVIRGGYGIFWLPNNAMVGNTGKNTPAYASNTDFVSSLDGNLTPADRLSNPFPNGIIDPPGRAEGADTLIGQGLDTWVREAHPGYTQHWNLNIQQQVGSSLAIEIAYAGSKGTHLFATPTYHQMPDEYLSLGIALKEKVPNPFYGLVTKGRLSAKKIARQFLLSPFPQFTKVRTVGGAPIGNSTYHSMQMRVTQRFARGALFTMAYTLSKTIGDTESRTQWLEPGGQSVGFYTSNNRRLDKSLVNFDATHRLVFHYNYQLPFGEGQPILGSVSGVAGALVSGWQINGITTLQNGFPLVVGRPNVAGNWTLTGAESDRLNRWFNTDAFVAAPQFTYGNAPRTLPNLRSDGIANWDFSLFKNTYIREGLNLQFRAEFFNLFNHVTFGRPDGNFGSAQYGVVSSQVNRPRQIQLALKLIF